MTFKQTIEDIRTLLDFCTDSEESCEDTLCRIQEVIEAKFKVIEN